jgi:hypothetical protein
VPASAADAVAALDQIYASAYPVRVGAEAAAPRIAELIESVETDDAELRARYRDTHPRVGGFFDGWFALSAAKPGRRSGKSTATESDPN